MSRNIGTFEGFFPSAPSVQQQKRKRAALDRERLEAAGTGNRSKNTRSPNNLEPVKAEHGVKRQRLSSQTGQEDRNQLNGEPGDLLNGVGSASSLNSTSSSVFSNHSHAHGQNRNGNEVHSYNQTPLTAPESSPPGKSGTPQTSTPVYAPDNVNVHSYDYDALPSVGDDAMAKQETRYHSPLLERPKARPEVGEVKGERAVYDPDLDRKLTSKERRNPALKMRYAKFGEKEAFPPPDPRLAVPGYRDGEINVHLKGSAKMWKTKLRHAPYTLQQYPWIDGTSIGSGPPTAVVVTGFDPFTPDTQLRAFFGGYGEIAAVENKVDPNTGSFLGICWIRYRDARSSRALATTAVESARRAEKEGTGQRIGLQTVKVERDRVGRRAKRYVDNASKKNEERKAREQQAVEGQHHRKPSLYTERSANHVDAVSTPPPNAPKGPSGRAPPPTSRMPESARALHTPRAPASSRIETEPILSQIRKSPYIYISHTSVPVMATTPPHLERRMKMFYWKEIRCDETGYYIVFEDSWRGKQETRRCHEAMNGQPMFTYKMELQCNADGNTGYVRSPSPETAAAERKKRDEQEELEKEDAADWEEELKQRAENLDPAKGALEQLKAELKEKIMADIKQRIAVPSIYAFLDPARHAARRQKLGLADPSQRSTQASSFVSQLSSTGVFRKRHGFNSITLSHKPRSKENDNVFADERRKRTVKKRPQALTLHHRLQHMYNEEDSEDDEKRGSREDTKTFGSTPISRLGSEAPGEEPSSRKHVRLETEDSIRGEDSGDEDFGIAKSVLDPHVLRKEPEDMAVQELHNIVSSLPSTSKLRRHALKELRVREKTLDDDRLFHLKSSDTVEPSIEDVGSISDLRGNVEIDVRKDKPSKQGKSRKKSKKQLFQEREAAKAALKAADAIYGEGAITPERPYVGTLQENVPGADAYYEEEERAEVEWGVSTDEPRRTVEDESELVMDIDGWQHLIKDDEDFDFLRNALIDHTVARINDARSWVVAQKDVKTLNNGGIEGISFMPTQIKGYYVPNITGSARTEGVAKILESEKSNYLPHRIRVREAREKRQADRANPTTQAEETRKAKQAATANSRTSRANNRTAIKDLNVVKQNLIADGQQGDAIRFNQLKKRKKLVRFERSAIHGWGLYADENIAVNDMIIEYVGEKVRQAVANIREDKYDKQGVGSSYLFRIDDDTIVDATKKGGIARFINHSCSPNCTAKIIKVDGSKRIVIYALREIAKSKSITLSLCYTNIATNHTCRRRTNLRLQV